ncbi:MAG: anthranilate phosphoribosyltransferase, partial [Cognaticolwellia sp.]
GAAAYVAGLHPSLEEGVQAARAVLHSGKVQGTLTNLIHESQQ